MRLHNDKKIFADILRATVEYFGIMPEFVEKDYWITLVLNRMSKSKYATQSVFKGGTSLSKGYNLIDRFSEDLDIAIISGQENTSNEIKNIIRTIEKDITTDLTELKTEGITSKGSRYRKSVFEYTGYDAKNKNNKLILEINSFANPFPFKMLKINSFVFDFLTQTNNDKYIEQYGLQSFEVNVLDKTQTLIEKMVSLIRFSFDDNFIESLSKKIRHFYDLYFLLNDSDCRAFIYSNDFRKQFNTILQHDKDIFDIPKGWQNKLITDSPLVSDFETIWKQLKTKYQIELSILAYRPIPDEASIAKSFRDLLKRIE